MVTGKLFEVTPPAATGAAPFQVVELTITCPVCGKRIIQIAAHHLRPMIELLQHYVTATATTP